MTLFDFLASSVGIELTHAVILLILAITGAINWRTHQLAKGTAVELHEHVNGHSTPSEDAAAGSTLTAKPAPRQ